MASLRKLQSIVALTALGTGLLGMSGGTLGYIINENMYRHISANVIIAHSYEQKIARGEQPSEEETWSYQKTIKREKIREDIQRAETYRNRLASSKIVILGSGALALCGLVIGGLSSRQSAYQLKKNKIYKP